MMNPMARRAMFEKYNQRFMPRIRPPVPPMPMPSSSVVPGVPSPLQRFRRGLSRYNDGGKVDGGESTSRKVLDEIKSWLFPMADSEESEASLKKYRDLYGPSYPPPYTDDIQGTRLTNPRMRYAMGGEVPNPGGIPSQLPGPMPVGRTIPDPRMPPNPIMPGPGMGTGPSRPDPLTGWSPFGAPQSGMGTDPGITWPDSGQAPKPNPFTYGGGFGSGKVQTFRHGGEVSGESGGGDLDIMLPGPTLPPNWATAPGSSPAIHNSFPNAFATGQPNFSNYYGPGSMESSGFGPDNDFGQAQGEYGYGFNPAMFIPPDGTPGFAQGATMIPTTFDPQGYPYAVPVMGQDPGLLAYTNPSDLTSQYHEGQQIHPVNTGGRIPKPQVPLQGYGKDTVPAALTPGEVVIPRPGDTSNARRKYLLAMARNESKKKQYNDGGYVPTPVDPTEDYPFNTDYEFTHHKTDSDLEDAGYKKEMEAGLVDDRDLETAEEHEAQSKKETAEYLKNHGDPISRDRGMSVDQSKVSQEHVAAPYGKGLTPEEMDMLHKLNQQANEDARNRAMGYNKGGKVKKRMK